MGLEARGNQFSWWGDLLKGFGGVAASLASPQEIGFSNVPEFRDGDNTKNGLTSPPGAGQISFVSRTGNGTALTFCHSERSLRSEEPREANQPFVELERARRLPARR